MSVAVEEMLHMSLSSNILFAMGVAPQMYRKAPKKYPTGLPYHRPKGPPGPDGKTAVLVFGGVYAAGIFGWDSLTMTMFGIVLSVFAVWFLTYMLAKFRSRGYINRHV